MARAFPGRKKSRCRNISSGLVTCPHIHWFLHRWERAAVQKAQELNPDLILLDIGLPNLNGIEAQSRLCRLVPGAKVLFLSQNNDAELLRAALSNGARGYVLKVDAGRELLNAIKATLRGERFVSSGIK
jgi:DNA-binding NarL/FixJ family response regulator